MVAVGALLSLLASVCFNVNNLMEKRAVDGLSSISFQRPGRMVRALVTSRLWMAGFAIGVVAVALLALGYSLAPTIVVQSIFGAGVVLLVLGARWYLAEQLGRREHLGIALIVVALVLVSATFGASTTRVVANPVSSVVIVSAATTAIAGVGFWLLRSRAIDSGVVFGVTSGLLYGVASLQTKAASALLELHGTIGGIPWLLESPYPYVFLGASLLGLFTFQTGLQRCRLAILSPLTSTLASVFVVIAGMIVYREPLPHNALLASLRFLGFAMVLLGGGMLATSSTSATMFNGVPGDVITDQ